MEPSEPFDLAACVGRRVRERAELIDVDRAARLALARLRASPAAPTPTSPKGARETSAQRVAACVDAALDALLSADRDAEHLGLDSSAAGAHAVLTSAFGIEPQRSRSAAVAFNELPQRLRRSFFALVIEGHPVERCVAQGLAEREELRRHARAGLEALGLLDASDDPLA